MTLPGKPKLNAVLGWDGERGEHRLVELAGPKGLSPAATWAGAAVTEEAAIAMAKRDATTGLRAMSWRKGARGLSKRFAWTVLRCAGDEGDQVDSLTLEPPALAIPGVRRRGEGDQRPLTFPEADAYAADVLTCIAALATTAEWRMLVVDLGYELAIEPEAVEKRRRRHEKRVFDYGSQSIVPQTFATSITADQRNLDIRGPLHQAALAIAAITSLGATDPDGDKVYRARASLRCDGSATLAAAMDARNRAQAPQAAARLAALLAEIGAPEEAAALLAVFPGINSELRSNGKMS